jgi:acetyltransferase-like isoleucine patch superfamily enzyme
MTADSLLSRLHMLLRRVSGNARGVHSRASVHYSVELSEQRPGQIALEKNCVIGRHSWLNVICELDSPRSPLRIDQGVCIGRNNVISAKNQIVVQRNVVTAPQVLIMDHGHEFADVTVPILHQGVTEGGTITLEEGCWIGFGSVIICSKGTLRIGRNAVVGANSVVTRDVEPMTVVVGSPARVVRRYEPVSRMWVKVE